jgi:hypothetical protein
MKSYHKTSSNFVAPLTEPRTRVEIVDATHELPAPPQTVLLPHAGYEDRAKGFSLATGPLAAATGFVVLLIGIAAFGVPVLSVAALLLALGGFTMAWLAAYVIHTLISPDGATFAHVVMAWGYLRREQRERHQRYASLRDKRGDK